MNATLRQVSNQLFEQHDLQKVQMEELDYLIEEYPFFSAFHILKAKKMMTEHHQHSEHALQKAAIYFYNPHWLNYQILHDEPFIPHEEPLGEILSTPDSDILSDIDSSELVPESEIEMEAQEVSFDNKRIVELKEIEIKLPQNTFQVNTTNDEIETGLTFDPLHTIDYFASQGIKIPAEIIDQDQLSIKLRSFTEWLRTMKKLHPEKFQQSVDAENEKEVISMEQGNLDNEVLTEAMAEVYALQGLHNKAILVYEKLSLLEPQKSDYFALRIKELK